MMGSSGYMRPPTGPASHHGATPTRDPRVPGITAGGDGAEPLDSRPHREYVFAAMAVVVLAVGFLTWVFFRPAGSDAEARAEAAELGLTVADDVRVESIDGGFRLFWKDPSDRPTLAGFYFDVVETASVSAPADLGTWEPTIDGATAYTEGEPPRRVLIDAGAHSWIATPGTPSLYTGSEAARAAWYQLADSISFSSGA